MAGELSLEYIQRRKQFYGPVARGEIDWLIDQIAGGEGMTDKERARLAHVEEAMLLPMGKTCGDCQHYERCQWLIQCKGWEVACDWNPSRFKAATEPGR